MGKGIAGGIHLPAPVDEGVGVLGGHDGIEHDGNIPAGGIFHAHRDVNAAGGQSVFLVFDTPRTHRHVGQQVGKIAVIVGVEHFVGGGKAGVGQHIGVQAADGDDALQHIGGFPGVGLVEKTLVAVAGGAGLVGVDPGNQNQLVRHRFLQFCQPLAVFQHRVLPVGGAGADDQHHFAAFSGENVGNFLVPAGFDLRKFGGQGVLLLDLLGNGQFALENHILHDGVLSLLFSVYAV